MADGFVHTVYKNDQWVNEIEAAQSSEVCTRRKKEAAVAAGRERAKAEKTEHVIHTQDGVISERNSYGNDRTSRPG